MLLSIENAHLITDRRRRRGRKVKRRSE